MSSAPPAFLDFSQQDLIEALPAAVYVTDADGRLQYFNAAAAELWGREPVLGDEAWCGSWRLYWPDGAHMAHAECPMAVALQRGRPLRGAEAICERPDGSRVPFAAYPTPLHKDGKVVGAINLLIDMSDQQRAQQAELHLAAIVASSDDAIVSTDFDRVITSWNDGAARMFGISAEAAIGSHTRVLFPDTQGSDESEIWEKLERGERVRHYETTRRHKDGRIVEVSVTASPIRDLGGAIIGHSGIARDITERKRAQDHRDLLLREMGHRVKNLFTIAEVLINKSERASRTPHEMGEAIRGRLHALLGAYELAALHRAREDAASQRLERRTDLGELVRMIFAPYVRGAPDGRLVATGPEVVLGDCVSSFALALHELATNAVKYGALSCEDGQVLVEWELQEEDLLLRWRERGGPPVDGEPQHAGFGSSMLRQAIVVQLGGAFSAHWNRSGLEISISAPMHGLAA